ncbi:lytic polysaccharide monooxygenase [Dactylosporangium sp. AC04546]|uniref:lytic polysaccharide monooxygenase n=1 Tax=Dactylosporangium sp. AC04546 TaxID=2862460 RepID=UPI001EDFA31A|nr:lytic polysaccharide monooxygenase [Dactylosporangium sp. AC04546]WVK86035.1 lytic polysaccharide monooxygenase [Dactylosporangium sp. AC04546]
MRKTVLYPLVALGAAAGSLVFAAPASAHGYVSSPPSRQALCAQGKVAGCGPIQYEPQSVEGPKGLKSCNAGLSQFAVLNDDSRNWPATQVGTSVTFNWVLTARHATSTWEYFIGNTRVAQFNDGGKQPNATVSHQVSLAGYAGRQKILAVWNIADTANAFYNCVDVQIGSGGGSTPTPTPTKTASPTPTATKSPTKAPPTTAAPTSAKPTQATGTAWAAGTTYKVGDVVTYDGRRYQCRQAHTAIYTWEPIYTLALWLPV